MSLRSLAAVVLLAPRIAAAQISVLGTTVQEHLSTPGQEQRGTLLVANASNEPQTVRVYQTDYWFDAAGQTRYDAPATRPRSNAAWVTLGASQLVVPAGGTVPLHYTVRTPQQAAATGASPAGTFWSLIMIEPTPNAPSAPAAPGAGQIALSTSVRYAVQVATHVAGGGAPAAVISAPRVAGANGALTVEFDLENTGPVGYRSDLSLELIDATGRSAGTFRARRGLLYPGTSLRQRFECAGVPRGSYTAVIVADTGDDVFGTQLPIRW